MLRVVIVDDEVLVRVGLKSMINWQEQGFEIIGEALNGQAGYDLIKNTRPDIVITDIKMPVVNGLEMIEKLIEEGINSKFIILSSYDEFNLVRKAMKYGVKDYLIKLELEPDLLIGILSGLKDKIDIGNKKQNEDYKTEKYIRANKYAMREEFFKKVIGEVIKDEKDIQEELDYLQISINKNSVTCIVIQISNTNKLKNYEEAELNLLEFSILNIVDEIVNDFFIGYSFKWTNNQYMIIFSNEDKVESNIIRNKIENMTERIIVMLKQYFNLDVYIAVSNANKGLSGIKSSYMESCKALQKSFYNDKEKVIFFNNINLNDINLNDINLNENKKVSNNYEVDTLLKYIESNDLEAIEIMFEDIISFLNNENVSKEMAYDLCAKITYLITIAVEKDEKSLKYIFDDNDSVFEKIQKLGSISDITNWLSKIQKGISNFLLSKSSDQNSKMISTAKKYIRENIGRVINLQDVASLLNISSGYLSTIFKQSTGITFIDYVTEIKIQEAKRLLKESNYKIYEIAQMIGYENAYYFSKVFKKVTGITPREFIIKGN